jgi:hypothetical protein
VLGVTSLPLATQRLFAHIVGSPRRSFAFTMLGRAELPGRAELAGLRPATRLLIVGLAAWICLVGLATVVAIACVEMSSLSLPAWFGARTSPTSNTAVHSPAGFESILSRPLFSRNRQDAPAAVPAPPPPPAVMLDQNITLKGVFMSGAVAKAFLISAQNPLGVWVQANDEVAGWRVVAVKPDQVLLDAQNEKLVIPLKINGTAK